MEKKLKQNEVQTMIEAIMVIRADVAAKLSVMPDDIQLKAYRTSLENAMCQLNASGITNEA